MELNALGFLEFEQLREMPGDGFPFAVGIGGKIDMSRLFGCAAQLFDDVALAFDGHIGGREVMLDIDAEAALGKIADVSDRREYLISGAEEFFEGTGFRR